MIFLISDLHLSPARPEITQAFYHFLDTTAANAKALYILGDFFDAWIGDDDDTPAFREIEASLAKYNHPKQRTYFMHGNRDFMVGDDFAQRTGINLLSDPTTIELAGVNTLLMHGDSLCTLDKEYMAFRHLVRDPEWQQNIMQKSLAERKALAAQMQSTSKSMNSIKAEDIMDVTPEEVTKIMTEKQTPVLIHGHTHRPDHHKLTITDATTNSTISAERIVLGDWHDYGWYLAVDNNDFKLEKFKI